MIKFLATLIYLISLTNAECDNRDTPYSLYAFEDGLKLQNNLEYLGFNRKFRYFNKDYNGLKFSKDGVCLLTNKTDKRDDFSNVKSFFVQNKAFIAPFWSDNDQNNDQIYYKLITDSDERETATLETITCDIRASNETYRSFKTNNAVLITWFEVSPFGYRNQKIKNTFQLVLTSNEKFSFLIFKYGEMQLASKFIIGYNSGIGKIFDLTSEFDLTKRDYFKVFRVDSEDYSVETKTTITTAIVTSSLSTTTNYISQPLFTTTTTTDSITTKTTTYSTTTASISQKEISNMSTTTKTDQISNEHDPFYKDTKTILIIVISIFIGLIILFIIIIFCIKRVKTNFARNYLCDSYDAGNRLTLQHLSSFDEKNLSKA